MPAARPLIERLFEKFYVDDNGCWIWTAATVPAGYGIIAVTHGVLRRAHRLSYEFIVGPIPEGLDLDHLCRVRPCINPYHLEPVTRAENLNRSPLFWASIHKKGRNKRK